VLGITEVEVLEDYTNNEIEAGYIIACNRNDGLIVKTADNKKLKINILFTNEGFFSGGRMAETGLKPGMQFI
jgi:methionyl-tRNA formyltransferase